MTKKSGCGHAPGIVPNALALLQEFEEIQCAALCYGYMVDADERDDVARPAEQWGFVTPPVDVQSERFKSVPVLVVRAGHDEMSGLNDSADTFVGHALRENWPVTVVNHAEGIHGFDVLDATARSRVTVRQILHVLEVNLLD